MIKLFLFLLLGAAGLWAQNQNLGNITVNNIKINGLCTGNCSVGTGGGNITGSSLANNAAVFASGLTAIQTDSAITHNAGTLSAVGFIGTTLLLGGNTYGRQPATGFSAEVWNNAYNRFGYEDSTANINTFGLTSLVRMLPSGSTGLFSKNAIIGWCQNDDGTAAPQPTGGCTGVVGYGTIGTGVTTGRATGMNALSGATAPSDGAAIGMEVDMINSSGETTNVAASNVKVGLDINSGGTNRPTAALLVGSSSNSNRWFYGVIVGAITPGGVPYSYRQVGNTSCTSTGIGSTGTCTMDPGSQDLWGSMTLTPAGTGIVATGTLTLTFSQQLGGLSPICIFQLTNGTGGWQPTSTVIVSGRATTTYAAIWTNASTVMDNTHTWNIMYHCDAK